MMPAATALTAMTSRLAARGPALTRTIALPKVSLGTQVSMKPVLTALGMGVAFTPAADFTGLSPQACCIGLVEQAATLGVGEKGTAGQRGDGSRHSADRGAAVLTPGPVQPSLPDAGD